ncbi:hypothetical protein N0V94_003552 [Neodidymelliopsis sp. IMI 364377]|nr:hypothetical protein N0V94_003552 [Neodidymelliopsis sp. IMI 364377]
MATLEGSDIIVDGISAKILPRPQQRWFFHQNRTYEQRVSLLREFALECHQSRLQTAERDLAMFCSSKMIHGEFRNELGYQITVLDPHHLAPATQMPFIEGHFWQRTSRGIVRNAPEDEYCFYPGMWWPISAPPLFEFDTTPQQPLSDMLPATHVAQDVGFAVDNLDLTVHDVDLTVANVDSNIGNTNLDIGNTNLDIGNTNLDIGNTNLDMGNTSLDMGNTNFNMGNTNFNMGNTDFDMGNTDFDMGNTDFDMGLFADVDFNVDLVADTGADIDLATTTQQPSPPQEVAEYTIAKLYVAASSSASPFASQSPPHTPQGVSEQQQDAEPVDDLCKKLQLVKQWVEGDYTIAQEVGAV